MMKGKYRIYVLGEIPKDLREQVSEIHGAAILAQKKDNSSDCSKRSNYNKGKNK
jgi:hypothetical protein